MWNTLHASATCNLIYKMTHTFTRKMQARFAINHDYYYSTVNCQSLENFTFRIFPSLVETRI